MEKHYISFDEQGIPYLEHYGIKGQKWGIRRFQNPDGTLTAEGKKRAKAEYKSDNSAAYEKGKTATVLNRAAEMAKKNLDRAQKHYDKNPDNEKNKKSLEINKKTYSELNEASKKAYEDVIKHRDSLIKKYGKDAIKDIKLDKKNRISERTFTNSELFGYLGVSLASIGGMMAGLPFGIIVTPTTAIEKGAQIYNQTYIKYFKETKNKSNT